MKGKVSKKIKKTTKKASVKKAAKPVKKAVKKASKPAKKKAAADAASNVATTVPEKSDPAKNSPGTPNTGTPPSSAKPVAKTAAPTLFDTKSDIALSGNFEKDKGHLPWPIASGNIAMRFGPHEYIKGIVHNNQGITIESPSGSAVTAVFDGVVQSVFNVGDVSAVMLRHGKYFTTYSNLATVAVSKGEAVKTGQLLGKLGEIGQLEFVLSDEKDRLFDPERWLRR